MNADELRAKQAPLKQMYRDKPETALIPAHAEGTLDLNDVAITVHAWHGDVTAGLHKAGGGSGELWVYAADSGKVLKVIKTGSHLMAAPMTYSVNGEQFVAIQAGY